MPEAEAFARSRGKRAATTHYTVFSSTKVVAFTAHDGGILAERHPSKMRAVTARVRHLLSLDPRGLGGSIFGKRSS